MEVYVSATIANVVELRGQRRAVALGRVPLTADIGADAGGEWRHYRIVRIIVVEGRSNESPNHRTIHARRYGRARVDMRVGNVIVRVGGLRPGEVEVVDRRGHGHRG